MEEYERIHPGATAFFFRAYEEETQHRRGLEQREIDIKAEDMRADRREAKCGIYAALWVSTVGICGALLLGLRTDNQIAASIVGGTPLILLAKHFIDGRKRIVKAASASVPAHSPASP